MIEITLSQVNIEKINATENSPPVTPSPYIYMYSSSYKQFKLLWFPYSLTDLLIVTIMGYELIYANTSFLLLLLFPHFFQQCRNDHICIYMQLFNTTLSLYLIIQVPIHIHPIPIIIFFSLHHYLHDYTVE